VANEIARRLARRAAQRGGAQPAAPPTGDGSTPLSGETSTDEPQGAQA
jgi:hypothetical protein